MNQSGGVLETSPVFVVEKRHAVIGPKDFIDGIAIQKTAIHNWDVRVGGARDHTVDIRHAFKSVHEFLPIPGTERLRERQRRG
jgi:hypothetical protein